MILPNELTMKNMVNEHALTVSLEEFGLSRYEAQAYVTLISKGTISASELAYYSNIPRTKVYPILLKLENKKLAIISKSKPILCTPISPEDAFDSIIHEQINKVNAMNTLISKLKKVELEKVKKINPEKYIFVTSLPLSRSNKEEILTIFKPYIKRADDIFGQEDLNYLLGMNPTIEEKHFKLWISSTTVFNRIINNAIKGRSEFQLEEIKNKSFRYNAQKFLVNL